MKKLFNVNVTYQYVDKFGKIIKQKNEFDLPQNIQAKREFYLSECKTTNVTKVNVIINQKTIKNT